MAEPKSTSRYLAEPMPYYYVDSWEALDSLPIAHTRGPFVISPVPSQPIRPQPVDRRATDEAYQRALADAIERGRPRWLEILASEGGMLGAQHLASLLGISRQAVDKRRRAGTLLGLTDGGRAYLYPAWQIQDGRPLPGLERVLAALNAGEHPVRSQLIFFLSPRGRLGDRRALDVLREGTEEGIAGVEDAALTYLEQGGQ